MALLLNAGDTVSRSYSYTQPSPLHPSQPQGTGERTGNLLSSVWEQGSINGTTGQNEQSSLRVRTAEYIEVSTNKIYSFSRSVYIQYMNVRFYSADKSFVGMGSTSTIRLIAGGSVGNPMYASDKFCCFEIIDPNIKYMRISDQSNDLSTRYMMVEGEYTEQTMPEYEPYGYKIPISSADTTTPVYLGEVQSTRRIGKIDLSELSWKMIINGLWATTGIPNIKYVSVNTELGDGISEKYTIHTGSGMSTALNCIAIDVSQVSVNTGSTSEKPTGMFWYVLATPETGILNEPLRKIRDYADEVSGITIPTIAGANTISVGTTLQPSEVSVNYHGWHPVQSVHERESGAWT